MTYVDDFGFERHSHHCGCDRCTPVCGHPWETMPRDGVDHVCNLRIHTAFHVCDCGAKTRVRTPRPEAQCWFDPKVAKRKAKRERASSE